MEQGKYQARIVDHGLTTTKSGNLQVYIIFKFDNGEQMTWYGSLNDGIASEITVNALLECGFNSENFEDLNTPNALIRDESIDVTLKTEVDNQGKDRLRIKYVGAGKEITRISKDEIRQKLSPNVSAKLKELLNKKRGKEDPGFEIPFGK